MSPGTPRKQVSDTYAFAAWQHCDRKALCSRSIWVLSSQRQRKRTAPRFRRPFLLPGFSVSGGGSFLLPGATATLSGRSRKVPAIFLSHLSNKAGRFAASPIGVAATRGSHSDTTHSGRNGRSARSRSDMRAMSGCDSGSLNQLVSESGFEPSLTKDLPKRQNVATSQYTMGILSLIRRRF